MSIQGLSNQEGEPLRRLPTTDQNATRWQLPNWEIANRVCSLASSIINCLNCGSLAKRQILDILDEKPLNENDFFQKKVHNVLRVIQIAEYINAPKEEIAKLIGLGNKFSAFTLLKQLDQFRNEFPEVFEKLNYEQLINDIYQVFQKYEVSFNKTVPSEDYMVFRPVDEFDGKRLVLGCGYAYTSCGGHEKDEDYLVTIEKDMKPDLCADYHSSAFWREFPNEKFEEVFFEGFLPDPDSFSLTEIARILKPEGIVRIGWADEYLGILKWVHDVDPDAFEAYIKRCGFSAFEIRIDSYRSNDIEGEDELLVLIK